MKTLKRTGTAAQVSRFAVASAALPVVPPIDEMPKPADSRQRKAEYARRKLATLEAAIRAEDWKEVSHAAGDIDQMARWLQLAEEAPAA